MVEYLVGPKADQLAVRLVAWKVENLVACWAGWMVLRLADHSVLQ